MSVVPGQHSPKAPHYYESANIPSQLKLSLAMVESVTILSLILLAQEKSSSTSFSR